MVIQFGGRAPLAVCGYPLRLPPSVAPKLRVSARWGVEGRCGFPPGAMSAGGGRMLANDNAALPVLWG